MRRILFFLWLCSISVLGVKAQSLKQADQAYAEKNYREAVQLYQRALRQGESLAVYYNLGNAYYRLNNIPYAILNYERALSLDPGDADIRFNLALARSKTIDKIQEPGDLFFVSWFSALVNQFSVDRWGVIALVSFALALVLFMVYLLSSPLRVRKLSFWTSMACFLVVVLSNTFAYVQHNKLLNSTEAIILNTVNVKSSPDKSGTDVFTLHGGTKATVTDGTLKNWCEISLSDGRVGWIPSSSLEWI